MGWDGMGWDGMGWDGKLMKGNGRDMKFWLLLLSMRWVGT